MKYAVILLALLMAIAMVAEAGIMKDMNKHVVTHKNKKNDHEIKLKKVPVVDKKDQKVKLTKTPVNVPKKPVKIQKKVIQKKVNHDVKVKQLNAKKLQTHHKVHVKKLPQKKHGNKGH